MLEQIEAKECMILSYKMLYHTLKHDLENYKLEDVKEMYSYLEKEIKELKLHKDVRLYFLFEDRWCGWSESEVYVGKHGVHFMIGGV
ncbi:hypothetical protein J0818_30350 [Bacillus cereus]